MVVEVLLQLLIDKVDGELLEAVVLEHLEPGDVQHRAEVGLNRLLMFNALCIIWKNTFFIVASIRVALHFSINHLCDKNTLI